MNTKVNMTLSAAGKPGLAVTESRGEIVLSGETSDVKLDSSEAKMQKLSRPDGSEVISIAFRAGNLYYVVMAVGIPETESLKVAESLSQ